MRVRTLTIVLHSHINDDAWEQMKEEIIEEVENQACDYAARARNDQYKVVFLEGVMQ